MFKLTDLTSKELSTLSWMCNEQIEILKTQLDYAKKWLEEGDTLERVIQQDSQRLETIREFHCQVLTAKQVVKENEKIALN